MKIKIEEGKLGMGGKIGYAVLCVCGPVLWGLVVVWVSNMIESKIESKVENRVEKSHSGTQQPTDNPVIPPIDYHI